jgi:DNA polymerase-3 subunit epsilon
MTNDISTLTFVAFDTETTGLYPTSEALVEIAAVRFDLVNGPKEYFQTLVNPERPIPWQATNVHGITDDMVSDAPTAESVLPSFFTFIQDAVPVAHHAPFDLGFISLHALRAGLLLPENTVLDSCVFAKKTFPEQPTHRLQALVQEFGIAESTFHRALADAKSCMEVFRHSVNKSCGVNANWETLLSAHGRTFKFGENTARPIDAATPSPFIAPLIQAVQNKKSLWMEYEGSFGPRQITPLLLYAKGSVHYMEATCHLDGIRKSFRLDRIKAIREPRL